MTKMPSRNTPPGKRDKALAARRRKILEAAVMCFLENGYHQTGVRDIATRAGVSLGNLYNHFPSKHDVLVEIAHLERAELDPFIRQLGKAGPAVKTLDRFITNYAKYLSAPENVILSIEITSEAIRKDDIAALFMKNRRDLVVALGNLLKHGADEGGLTPQADSQETAYMILELIEGRAYRCVLGQKPMRNVLPDLKAFLHAALGASPR